MKDEWQAAWWHPDIHSSFILLPSSFFKRPSQLFKLEPDAEPEVSEEGAEGRAGRVPDHVVHVRDARRQEVLPGFDGQGERKAEEDGQNVSLDGGSLGSVQRDEHQESPWHEEDDIGDDGHHHHGQELRRHGARLQPMDQVTHILERNRIDLRIALSGDGNGHQKNRRCDQDEQSDRDGTPNYDFHRRSVYTLTNFRKSTFRINPMATKNMSVAEPP